MLRNFSNVPPGSLPASSDTVLCSSAEALGRIKLFPFMIRLRLPSSVKTSAIKWLKAQNSTLHLTLDLKNYFSDCSKLQNFLKQLGNFGLIFSQNIVAFQAFLEIHDLHSPSFHISRGRECKQVAHVPQGCNVLAAVLFVLSSWFKKCMQSTLNMRNPAFGFDAGRITIYSVYF